MKSKNSLKKVVNPSKGSQLTTIYILTLCISLFIYMILSNYISKFMSLCITILTGIGIIKVWDYISIFGDMRRYLDVTNTNPVWVEGVGGECVVKIGNKVYYHDLKSTRIRDNVDIDLNKVHLSPKASHRYVELDDWNLHIELFFKGKYDQANRLLHMMSKDDTKPTLTVVKGVREGLNSRKRTK